MANVKDAEVLIVGTVLSIDELSNRETGEFTGRKITLLSPEGGVAIVKVLPVDRVNIPARGTDVAWMIRNTPYAIEGNSGMSTKFVREFSQVDLDAILSVVDPAPAKA